MDKDTEFLGILGTTFITTLVAIFWVAVISGKIIIENTEMSIVVRYLSPIAILFVVAMPVVFRRVGRR